MKKSIITLYLLLISLLLSSCSQHQAPIENSNQIEDMSRYTAINDPVRKVHNTFSIVMPGSWNEIASGMMVSYQPEGNAADDPLSEKVVVVVSIKSEEDARMPLKERAEIGMENLKTSLPDLEYSFDDLDARLDGMEAIQFSFNASIQEKKVSYTQISGRKDNMIYGIMHSCVEGQCQYIDVYNDMVSSFRAIDYNPVK